MKNRQITKIEPIETKTAKFTYIRYPNLNKTYKVTYIYGQPDLIEEVDVGLNTPLELQNLTEMYNGESYSYPSETNP